VTQGIGAKATWGTVAIAIVGLALSPAIGQSRLPAPEKRQISVIRTSVGSFTPAAADPRLAAAFARGNLVTSGFRFTPVSSSGRATRALTVAVRARSTVTPVSIDRPSNAIPTLNIAPLAYNLGVSLGWKRFAISGEVAQTDLGVIQGGRRVADVGVSYTIKKWTTRVQLATDVPVGKAPLAINNGQSVAVDFGSSYRLTRNLDVTAGVRYKSERDRLVPLADNRRDSQAIYVGTAFKF
jgi:hypothetical protein